MKPKLKYILVFLFLSLHFVNAKTTKVQNIAQYKEAQKSIAAGDSIVLANGVWNNVEIIFKGNGTESKNIFLVAETPGKVTIEGQSRLQLSGNYLVVSGLVFTNGYGSKKTVIEFKTSSKDYAYNSTLTNCVIDKYNQPAKDSADQWIGVWGKKNTIEYCYFGGKSNEGTTLVVWPNDSNSIDNGHLIYRNYFGPRPRLGANGGETIRIGTSQVCHMSSRTIVDGNFFEQCNGEVEIISIKSGDNMLVNNTFLECEGSLVLRHGNNSLVSGNWFLGNGKPFTGGVRVINEGHKVINNYFYKLTGDEFRSATAIMNGIPDSPANGYAQVKNVIIANNTYYMCDYPWGFSVGLGFRNRIARPESTLLLNNLIYSPATSELIKSYDKVDGIKMDNNLLISSKGVSTEQGTVKAEVQITKVWGMDVPVSNVKAKKLPFVKCDILGQTRVEAVVGAFQDKLETAKVELATSANCGPAWYKVTLENEAKKAVTKGKTIEVAVGIDNLTKALKKAGNGDVFVLSEGEYLITNKIAISKNISIKSGNAKIKPVIRLQSERDNNCFFEISESAYVVFDGIAINGDSKAKFPAKYFIVSDKNGAMSYALTLNNCDIYDFNVETGAIIKAYKGTMSDSITIRNSILRDSYRGISLNDEKEDVGKYSVEYLRFDNSVFSNFKQYLVDFYRGGNDESTLGGTFRANHCVFNNIGADEKQTILKLTNIVNVSIENSIFNNSLAKTTVKLSGIRNSIKNCALNSCAAPKVESNAISENVIFENPRFEKKNFGLSDKSKLKGKASDGGNIGLK